MSYPPGMDTVKDARIKRDAAALAKDYKQVSDRAYWLGVILGVLVGLGLGLAIGYQWGSPTTVVVPLGPGVEV